MNRKKEARWNTSAGSNSLWDVSNAFCKRNILTETDLVKLKNQYPGYDQAVSSALGSTTRYADGQYVYPDNGQTVGSISPEIARTLRLDKPGAIVLDDTGLRHIEERHGKEIRSLGFHDGLDFVNTVLTDVDAVYAVEGSNRKYDLVSRVMTPQGRVMVRLEFAENGDFYSVAAAGPLRGTQYQETALGGSAFHSFPDGNPLGYTPRFTTRPKRRTAAGRRSFHKFSCCQAKNQ